MSTNSHITDELKPQIMAILEAQGAEQAIGRFYGGGDEGDLSEAVMVLGGAEYEATDELEDLLRQLVDDEIDFNNEGKEGEFICDLAEGSIILKLAIEEYVPQPVVTF